MYSIEIAPFSNFKQRVKLVNEFKNHNNKITIFDNYLCIEKFNISRKDGFVYDANNGIRGIY